MKKVIFICLLSVAVCLSKPSESSDALPVPSTSSTTKANAQPAINTQAPATAVITSDTASPTNINKVLVNTKSVENSAILDNNNASGKENANNKQTKKVNEDNVTAAHNESKPSLVPSASINEAVNPKNIKPSEIATKANDTATKSGQPANKPGEATNKPDESTNNKPSEGTAKPTAGPSNSTDTSTKPADTPSKEEDKKVQAKGFDGASFIGGIILTLGLLAIGFMGFKYYKNQTERNYHTL